jgi:CRISPR-associated protein Cst1
MGSLNFSGNWYFDCGIIGFLSVIDDVFGEEEVNNILDTAKIHEKNNTLQFDDRTNYIFFQSYWGSYLKSEVAKLRKKELINKVDSELKKITNPTFFGNFDREMDNFIKELTKLNNSIIINNKKSKHPLHKNMSPFYVNFAFFNNPDPIKDSKEYFFNYHTYESKGKGTVRLIERALNKFLPSYTEFANEFFDEPLRIREIENTLNLPLHIFLMCVEKGFVNFKRFKENIFVYAPSLEISWKIHKKLKILAQQASKEEKDTTIFSLTTDQIIDSLYEEKSEWVLRNLLIITHSGIDKKTQAIQKVKFLPFDKNTAKLLSNEKIRKYTIRNIKIQRGNDKEVVYGIDGLIYKKPLTPKIIDYLLSQNLEEKKNLERILDDSQQFLYWATIDLLNQYKLTYASYNKAMYELLFKEFLGRLVFLKNIFSDPNNIIFSKKEAKSNLYFILREGKNLDKFSFINYLLKFIWDKRTKQELLIEEKKFMKLLKLIREIAESDVFVPYLVPITLGLLSQYKNSKF